MQRGALGLHGLQPARASRPRATRQTGGPTQRAPTHGLRAVGINQQPRLVWAAESLPWRLKRTRAAPRPRLVGFWTPHALDSTFLSAFEFVVRACLILICTQPHCFACAIDIDIVFDQTGDVRCPSAPLRKLGRLFAVVRVTAGRQRPGAVHPQNVVRCRASVPLNNVHVHWLASIDHV